MAMEIQEGTLVKVGDSRVGMKLHITTMNREGRFYERDKLLRPGQFLFGIVEKVHVVQPEKRELMKDDKGKIMTDDNGNPLETIIRERRVLLCIAWDGPRYRTSTLSGELATPAIN